ncbi:YqzE family protein [Paenibacillus larvae]|uniref:YqzE family protein n=3 Tax=Paenibacillus larvae TaxID=1464 RepID=A0A2L1UBL1_9BACL|nr:YqzE family protein [Paenibacillus larvae]AQR79565.1 hypothetical protein BXP28_22445 [Paenibacillus larvae subsp. larvae]AQT86060.1 hypothetical protein B1222_19180 [Paenibacillus larvae subsp. pulvifaciens]AQZ45700.1 hypothetical protein B5S25_02875 [Paenibacillus larvae subsp. pulvifaciens]ARF69375.1 hypothetical protein B7C51_18470 [Paenibacillus larvae subsp. pulvifaciens]AVF23234.1 hypothetical protein ERICI_03471 [Paenibacillus larvae subsp. larvae]
MAVKGDDLVKYITERVITYIDTPRELRKEKRKQQKAQKEPWTTRWFGLLPLSISLWNRNRKDKRSRRVSRRHSTKHSLPSNKE